MASTSPGGASSNVRRSVDVRPQPPATPTDGSSRARTSGVTTSPVGSTLASIRITTRPAARLIPIFVAAAWPSRSEVHGSRRRSRRPPPCRAPGLLVRRLVGDDDDRCPLGRVRPSAIKARSVSAGKSVAISTTVARPTGGSPSLDGTLRDAPYRTRAPSSMSGGDAGDSAKSVPRSRSSSQPIRCRRGAGRRSPIPRRPGFRALVRGG